MTYSNLQQAIYENVEFILLVFSIEANVTIRIIDYYNMYTEILE